MKFTKLLILTPLLLPLFIALQACSLMGKKQATAPLVTAEINSNGANNGQQKNRIISNDIDEKATKDTLLKNTTNIIEIDPGITSKNTTPLEITSETIYQQNSSSLHLIDDQQLLIESSNLAKSFMPGEALNLVVKTQQDGHLYCFFNDASNKVMRIFPNRFNAKSHMSAEQELLLPGAMPFEILANQNGKTEQISCFLTHKEVLSKLPDNIKVLDFVTLKVSSMNEITQNILEASGNNVFANTFDIVIK